MFGRGVAFGEVGEAEPVPVMVIHELAEDGFVAGDVGFEVFERILVEIHVGPGVIAEGIAGVAPGLEDGEIVRFFFENGGVDEAVDGREMSGVKGGENFVGDDEARFVGWERAVGGEIVEGEGELERRRLGWAGECEEKRENAGGEENHECCISSSNGNHRGSPGQRVLLRSPKQKVARSGRSCPMLRGRGSGSFRLVVWAKGALKSGWWRSGRVECAAREQWQETD